jgi:hypothetical protein
MKNNGMELCPCFFGLGGLLVEILCSGLKAKRRKPVYYWLRWNWEGLDPYLACGGLNPFNSGITKQG